MSIIKFIHITKTAGTSIENVGLNKGFLWGKNDPFYKNNQPTKFKNRSRWHIPLKYYENFSKKNSLFTVVRNPYTRCLSETYCPWIGIQLSFQNYSVDDFNLWIQSHIKRDDIVSFLPQHHYMLDKFGNNIIDYVLKFENIKNDFNNLMIRSGYSCELDRTDNVHTKMKYNIDDFNVTTKDLIKKTYEKDFEMFGYNLD